MTSVKAQKIRGLIERLSDHLEDGEAVEAPELFPGWQVGVAYQPQQRVRYKGILYRCIQPHTAQPGWNPEDASSLWARVLIEDPDVVADWVQPGSTNPYSKGDRVRHNGSTWISTIDGNVWEPGVYGWEVTA